MLTNGEEWNPNDYQGRSKEQVESDMQGAMIFGGMVIIFAAGVALYYLGKWLLSLVVGM